MKMCLCSKVVAGMPLMDAMKAAADIGYGAVELFAIENHLPPGAPQSVSKELRSLLDDLGIELASLCSYVGNFDAKDQGECEEQMDVFRIQIEQAKILDIPWIRVNPAYRGYENPATMEEKKWFAEWAGKCADIAADAGLGICLENNLNMIATLAGTVEVLDLIDRDNAAASYDPGNIIRADKENYGAPAVEQLGERIAILQIKQIDMSLDDLQDSKVFVFYDEGDVDYTPIYKAIAGVKSAKYISVECHKLPVGDMTEKDVAAREYKLVREHAGQFIEIE